MSKLEKIIVIVASLVAVLAVVMLLKKAYEYKQAEKEYDALKQYASETTTSQETAVVSDMEEEIQEVEVEEEEVKKLARNFNRDDFPDIEVNFATLHEKNQDTVGWLYVPACNISYPIVQGEDNEYYMHHTFENTANASGAIIMDYRDNKNLEDWNTFIYGHNMKNGSMFGSLKKLINDESLVQENPYIYIFVPGYIYRYQIFSYYKDAPDSKMYWTPDTLQEYREYIRNALALSIVDLGVETSEENNMITLVTCSGSGEGKMRFFVHGEFVDRYVLNTTFLE